MTRVGAVLAIMVGWSGTAFAQDATGHIEGRVLAAYARPAAAVRVAASGPNLQLSREAETDVRGYFRLRDLPVGMYQVRLALVGYRPVRLEGITVRLGQTTSAGETRLEAQAFELGEIVVNAERPLVDVASAALVTNLPSEQFTNLPTERNFRSLVSLAPQANPSQFPGEEANISGSSGPENAYYLDGANITDPASASSSADLPYNFVRELQVKTGGYEAEYGRATGGIINVITHSGSNRFGGQVFGFFTNNGLTAEPRLTLEGARQSEFSEYDVGGSLGGPILRDRLWFFAAYDPNSHHQRVEVRGPELPDDQSTEHLFATKLTWQAGPQTDVVVTAHGDPSRERGVDLGSALDSIADLDAVTFAGHSGGLVLSALGRQRLGATAQAELGVARFTHTEDREDASGRTDPIFSDYTTGVVSGGFGHRDHTHTSRTTVRGSMAARFGRHGMKIGVEYEDNQADQDNDFSAEPGSPEGTILRFDSTTYVWFRGRFGGGGSVRNRVLTAYGQDSWQLGDRLTLNYGLRWDAQYLVGADGKLAQRFTHQWQPRLGFTCQLGAPGSQKIFGSYSRFYEQIPLQLLFSYYSPNRFVALQYDHDPRIDPSGADTVGDFSVVSGEFPPQRDLKGQSVDEFSVGYERALGRQFRVGVRGIYRGIHWVVEDGFDSATGAVEIGNPGRGNLASTPRARRTYRALVLTLEKPRGRRFSFLASYVLSRSWGNYAGLSNEGQAVPNITGAFDSPAQHPNDTLPGLLYNDKPQVLKLSGSYRFDFGLTVGTAIAWMSGEPRNELAQTPSGGLVLLRPLGSAGRTDAVFEADLRLTYALRPWGATPLRPKVYLDVFRLGNQRTVLDFQELHYLEMDPEGNPTTPNPLYGRPLQVQAPMSARIGLALDFGMLD
jgi:Carboxypeptidase regulatory-like domain/TonB dependent receptor/TonB-dependent Receptor Plug Domain